MKINFDLDSETAETVTGEDTYLNSHPNHIQDCLDKYEKLTSLNSTGFCKVDIEKSYLLEKATLINNNNKFSAQDKFCIDYHCENYYEMNFQEKIENLGFFKNISLFDLENLKIDENFKHSINDKKKGKSNPLPEEAEDIYFKVKLHYENKNEIVPHLFRKDGIRKKIKTHFFKWIKKNLDQKIKEATGDKKLKFKKLEQNTIANINLKFNSDLLQKSVFQVYNEDCEKNKKLMQMLREKIISQKEKEKISGLKESLEFLDTPLHSLYNKYFKSKQYKKDFKKIKKKLNYLIEEEETEEDKEFILLYLKIYEIFSENFVNYYMETLPNHRSFPTNRRPIKNSTEYENETNSNSKSESESESKSEEN
jgi:hypothetical protein